MGCVKFCITGGKQTSEGSYNSADSFGKLLSRKSINYIEKEGKIFYCTAQLNGVHFGQGNEHLQQEKKVLMKLD